MITKASRRFHLLARKHSSYDRMHISANVLCSIILVFCLIGILKGVPLVADSQSTVAELEKEINDILKDLENEEPEEPIIQNGKTDESLPTFDRQPFPVNDCPLCIPDIFKWKQKK